MSIFVDLGISALSGKVEHAKLKSSRAHTRRIKLQTSFLSKFLFSFNENIL